MFGPWTEYRLQSAARWWPTTAGIYHIQQAMHRVAFDDSGSGNTRLAKQSWC